MSVALSFLLVRRAGLTVGVIYFFDASVGSTGECLPEAVLVFARAPAPESAGRCEIVSGDDPAAFVAVREIFGAGRAP